MLTWHKRVRLTLLIVLVSTIMSACSVGGQSGDIDGQGQVDSAEERPAAAVSVPGVESCRTLPLRPPQNEPAGGSLPSMELVCLTPGPAVDLSQLGGKPVLINLWASWCMPCREEMPTIEDAYGAYRERVQFLGVDTRDGSESAAEFLQEVGVTYPQLADPGGRLLANFRIPGLPATILIDADGEIVKTTIGPLTDSSLRTLLERVT